MILWRTNPTKSAEKNSYVLSTDALQICKIVSIKYSSNSVSSVI